MPVPDDSLIESGVIFKADVDESEYFLNSCLPMCDFKFKRIPDHKSSNICLWMFCLGKSWAANTGQLYKDEILALSL